MSVERAEGLEAVFRCQYQAEGLTVTYFWFVNNSLVITDTTVFPGEPTTLTIMATPQHNNSVVQCQTFFMDGMTIVGSELSATATLTVHGELVTFFA